LSYKKRKHTPQSDWRVGKKLNAIFQVLVHGSVSTAAATTVRISRVAGGSQPRDGRTAKNISCLGFFG